MGINALYKLYETTTSLNLVLIAAIITVFIFAVTLLGNVIERAREEKTETKRQKHKDFEIKINDIENKVKTAKEKGDPDKLIKELQRQLRELKKNREKFDKQLKQIQNKYSLLRFKQSVIYPGRFFIFSISLNEFAKIYIDNIEISITLWISSVIAIGIGIYRMCRCLLLVQEISAVSEEFQAKRLVQALITALDSREKKKEEELSISFQEISFPHTCSQNTELRIPFRVILEKGKIARRVRVWFFIPDGFELIAPKTSWPQSSNFIVPNIRTVKIELGDVSIGPWKPGSLRIRTPDTAGDYFLMYTLYAEGYRSARDQLKITVK